jgi:hypothetical protein
MTLVAASDPTSIPAGVPEDAVDELYGLALDEFTPRRDELAKELRRAGKRDAAAWVKGLRKPSASAWVVNQLSRTRARERQDLLRAGQELRDAHERVVAGDGDAGELRAAAEAEHAAASALASDAPGFLDREGHAPSRATLDRVGETIRAVALDDEARAGFETGRVTRERSASGFGPVGVAAPAGPRPRSGGRRAAGATEQSAGGGRGKRRKGVGAKPAGEGRGKRGKHAKAEAEAEAEGGGRATRKRGAGATTDADREARAEARAARDAARKALKEAKAAQRAHAREVKAAERELADARREAERAQRRLERAASGVEDARSREADAESQVARAEAELGG